MRWKVPRPKLFIKVGDSFVDEIDKLKTEINLNKKAQMEMFPPKKNLKKEKE